MSTRTFSISQKYSPRPRCPLDSSCRELISHTRYQSIIQKLPVLRHQLRRHAANQAISRPSDRQTPTTCAKTQNTKRTHLSAAFASCSPVRSWFASSSAFLIFARIETSTLLTVGSESFSGYYRQNAVCLCRRVHRSLAASCSGSAFVARDKMRARVRTLDAGSGFARGWGCFRDRFRLPLGV